MLAQRRSFLAAAALAGSSLTGVTKASNLPPITPDAFGTTGAYFNVKDSGAVGNGSSDDTAAIKQAIMAAGLAGGGIVLFPAGTYLVTSPINIPYTPGPFVPITLQGVGAAVSTLLVPSTVTTDTLVVGSSSFLDGFAMRDMGIVSTSARTAGRSIYMQNTVNGVIDHVNMTNQFVGCEVNGGDTLRVLGSLWDIASGGTGFRLYGTNNDTYLDNLYIVGAALYSFDIQNTDCIIMNACECIQSTYGLHIAPGSGQIVRYSFFNLCAFDSTTSHCILISPSGTGFAGGLTFTNCWTASTSGGDCCAIAGNTNGVDFVGCRFLNAVVGNGLWISGPATNVHADACVAASNGAGTGFVLTGSAQYCAIRNCYGGAYADLPANKYGAQITAGCSNYFLINNIFHGNSAASFVDAGSAPKFVNQNLS